MTTFTRSSLLLAVGAAFIGLLLVSQPVSAAAPKTQGEREPSLSATELQAKYAAGQKIKILVVPGHEPGYGGAVFETVQERDLVVPIADALAALLRTNPQFEVVETRSATAWSEPFASYFMQQWRQIRSFITTNKKAMTRAIKHGSVETNEETVAHNAAADDVAVRLYGITKWANDNDVDLAIHVHLNDAPNHGPSTPGPYTGYAIYVPDHQLNNGAVSSAIAQAVALRLSAYHATSTMPGEAGGVVEDQELIAIGAEDTASYPSLLIEYSYIYEPQMRYPQARAIASADYASATYRGIADFFGSPVADAYGTSVLPYQFTLTPPADTESADAYALQAALHHLGFYPPAGTASSDCPVSGYMGSCTVAALKSFQKAHGLEDTGTLGPRTKALLAKFLP